MSFSDALNKAKGCCQGRKDARRGYTLCTDDDDDDIAVAQNRGARGGATYAQVFRLWE